MSDDCYSFMTGLSSYNSQLTHVYMLHTEKKGKPVLLFLFNMAFPTSPFNKSMKDAEELAKEE